MSETNVEIKGTGYYVPEIIVTNYDLEKTLDTSHEWILEKIGIEERRVAPEKMVSSDMGEKAANMAMDNAGVQPHEIDMIILATNTPDNHSPACAVKVQEKIGAKRAFAFDIRAGGCPGLLYALSVASQYIKAGSCKTVLIIAVDMNSRGVNWNDRKTCVFLGDGSSSMVLKSSGQKGIIDTMLFTDPKGYYHAYLPAGGTEMPINAENLEKGLHYFSMDGPAIYKYATTVFPESVKKITKKHDLGLKDIDYIISHQANINIIKHSMHKLGVDMSKTYCNINKYGNTGGASVGIAFAEAIEKKLIKKNDIITLVAFGGGYSWGTTLLQWNQN